MSITPEEISNRFDYHPPSTPEVGAMHAEARAACEQLARHVLATTIPCREQSTALTKIEETMFWLNAAIARHQ